MNSNNRIIVNTIILYTKILIDIFISLWTVPIVLRALGQSDYGLYNLVAGVVAMLSFLNSSMTVVTQRYMSVTMGAKDSKKVNVIYNASIRIHIVLGLVLVVLFEICSPFLFNGFLNIESDRIGAAFLLYQFMIVSTFFTVLSVPFDATLNAYENMLYFAIIALFISVLKLLLAFSLNSFHYDRLVYYGLGIAILSIIGVISRFIYVNRKYKDLRIDFRSRIPKQLYNEMLSYAGWNTLGSMAMIGKNQGVAIILNLFKGTTINASYGIANQVNGLLTSFTTSIQKAVSPQLMKREGANERESMIEMSFTLIKITSIVFSLIGIPLILEMDQVLKIWLHDNVPPYTVLFCQLIITMQLVYQLSSGAALAIDAVGNIKVYRIVLSVVLFFNIPLAYIVLKMGYSPYYVLFSMIVVELLCLIVRLYSANLLASIPIGKYFYNCFIPITVTLAASYISGKLILLLMNQTCFRVVVVTIVTLLITGISSYFFVLNIKERTIVNSFMNSLLNKFQSHRK